MVVGGVVGVIFGCFAQNVWLLMLACLLVVSYWSVLCSVLSES